MGSFLLTRPTPFFISDSKYKKRINQIQKDFLYRMKKEDEVKFYTYLNYLIKVREEW